MHVQFQLRVYGGNCYRFHFFLYAPQLFSLTSISRLIKSETSSQMSQISFPHFRLNSDGNFVSKTGIIMRPSSAQSWSKGYNESIWVLIEYSVRKALTSEISKIGFNNNNFFIWVEIEAFLSPKRLLLHNFDCLI